MLREVGGRFWGKASRRLGESDGGEEGVAGLCNLATFRFHPQGLSVNGAALSFISKDASA